MGLTLITGVAGFTGRYLAQLLADQGQDVHGLVRRKQGKSIDGVQRLHEADLADLPSVLRIVKELRPERVVHLAAIAFVGHGDIAEMYRTNVLGTRQLLEAIVSSGVTPTSVLLASSANVYGNTRAGVLTEDLQPKPANDYGVSKSAMEQLAHIYGQRLPLIIVRPFNYTGRGQSRDFLIPKILEHIKKKKTNIELGNLEVARDFSDVRFITACYASLMAHPNAIGEIFNVSSGKAITLREIIESIRYLSGFNFEVTVNQSFIRANEVHTLTGSISKLETLLGPLRHVPLEETLCWMLADNQMTE